MRRVVLSGLVLLVGLLGAATGCASGTDAASPDADADAGSGSGALVSADPELTGTLTVLAAASLTETFTKIGEGFEAVHPGLDVQFSFGPSSGLAQQIEAGAPADVFASASASTMQQVVDSGDVGASAVFARNAMEIAVPPDNPAGVETVVDLADPGVTVALCEAAVPCGAAAVKVFDAAGVEVTPVTYGQDVKAVLTSVTLGEVDAGVVYVTDVRSAGDDVVGIEIPADVNATTDYAVAVVTEAPNPEAASAFAEYVSSDEAQAVLAEAGFQAS